MGSFKVFFDQLVDDFVSFLYPRSCRGCNGPMQGTETVLCSDCLFELPYTQTNHQSTNQFVGRLGKTGVTSLVRFAKDGRVQLLLHRLKYNKEPEIGRYLGQMLGQKLLREGQSFNAIVPIPMHPNKQRSRGYNQATEIALGIAEILGTTVEEKVLFKVKNTVSQTKKSKTERSQNIEAVFEAQNHELVAGKNVLLVDDVLTTGATLEACGELLLQAGVQNLHIGTLAVRE